MQPAFFYLIEESPPPPPPSQEVTHQLQEATGGRLETGSYFIHRGKLHFTAIPLEGWKNDHLQICPQVCKAILKEFQHKYLTCPTDPEDWKKIEERFKNRWNVPMQCTRWKIHCYKEAQEVSK